MFSESTLNAELKRTKIRVKQASTTNQKVSEERTMSYFATLVTTRGVNRYNGQAIWEYGLSEQDFQELKKLLRDASRYNLDTRDALLYYAEWWKHEYAGGKPSKASIFKSIGGGILSQMNEDDFYRRARRGAERLGVKWIVRNNTLYFRTLLMQGGLPLKHISENSGQYLDFLSAVLEEQPESVEDFSFNPRITGLLPSSCQNELIYENCFRIVRSILNEEGVYDDLLRSNETVANISNELKRRSRRLQRKDGVVKPKNYWLLSENNGKGIVELRLGFADAYSKDGLAEVLGFDPEQYEYQFYLNDVLVCVFRRMLSGKYKTNWFSQNALRWDGTGNLPDAYVIFDNERKEIRDFIQVVPDLTRPSLWTRYSYGNWRLVRGTGTLGSDACIMHPKEWEVNLESDELVIGKCPVYLTSFEGEVELSHSNETMTFKCGVSSFDWTIISDRPGWMLRSNMPVVRKAPTVLVYDDSGRRVNSNEVFLYIRKLGDLDWNVHNPNVPLSPGCHEVKIDFKELTAHDCFYNIGQFNIIYGGQSLNMGEFSIEGTRLNFSLTPSDAYEFERDNNKYSLRRNSEANKVPQLIACRLKEGSVRSLYFGVNAPFKGIAIVDQAGVIVEEDIRLSWQEINGLRILSNPGEETSVTIHNELKQDVKIRKTYMSTFQPIVSVKDDLHRLFNLAETMNFYNVLKLTVNNRSESKTYTIAGFSFYLDVSGQIDGTLKLYGRDFGENYPELIAIPLNVGIEHLEVIPVLREGDEYQVPNVEFTSHFIVIAEGDSAGKLMPRYVGPGDNDEMEPKEKRAKREKRLEKYHSQLLDSSFADDAWKELEKYFDLCSNYNIPFSTLDQIRSICVSSKVAAKAFFFFGQKSSSPEVFAQSIVPQLEQELGFNFHWVSRAHWGQALNEFLEFSKGEEWFGLMEKNGFNPEDLIVEQLTNTLQAYLGNIELSEFFGYLNFHPVQNAGHIGHMQINQLRQVLGERVLGELPEHTPRITQDYGIPMAMHYQVRLMLRTPIAAAESIAGLQHDFPIWSSNHFVETIRRNMQYAQYLNPAFYKNVLLYTLSKLN